MTGVDGALHEFLAVGWAESLEIPDLASLESPSQRIKCVAETSFSALGIPTELGGSGLGLTGLAAAQRALAMRDPSVAIAFNMHSFSVGLLTEHWDRRRDTSWMLLEGVARSHALVASAFAEPGGRGNFMRSRSVARPTHDGYVVTGVKYPCSLVSTADLYCLNARLEGTEDIVMATVPAGSPGMSVDPTWPSVGMVGSDTGRLTLDGVQVDRRLVHNTGPAHDLADIVVAGALMFVTLLAATYHGVMTVALIEAARCLAEPTVRSNHVDRRLGYLGCAVRPLALLGGSVNDTARGWESGCLRGPSALAAALALRGNLGDVRDAVVANITHVAGARLYDRTHALGALALDLLAVHHHPPNVVSANDALGSFALGRTVTLDPPE